MCQVRRWATLLVAGLLAAACSDGNLMTDPEVPGPLLFTTLSSGQQVDLVAGQNTVVGYVEVSGTDPITVHFVITDPDWCITQTHVAVVDDLSGIPLTKTGNPKVGHFPYGEAGLACVSTWQVAVPAPPSTDGTFVIAAAADVQKCEGEGTGQQYLFGTLDGDGNGDGDLYQVNPTTGDATLLYHYAADPSGNPFSPNGLAFDDVRERLYFSVQPASGTDIYYYNIDGSTTDPVLAGSIPQANIFDASWHGGEYYFIPNQTDNLWKITFDATGTSISATTLVCSDLLPGTNTSLAFGDIAISDDGHLYGWARNASSNDYYFFGANINDCTGKTAVNVTATLGITFNVQLALGEDGTLWGHKALSAGGANAGTWYSVDKTTGALTDQFVTSPSFTDISAGFQEGEQVCTTETAWADGQTGLSFAGSSWATYFYYTP